MLLGKIAVGATGVAIPANTKWVSIFPSTVELAPKLEVFGDTLSATGAVRMKAIAYDATTLALLGEGDEVIVPMNTGPRWLTLPFWEANPAGVLLLSTNVAFGVHVADAGLTLYHDGTESPGGMHNADAYSDGAAAVFGASTTDAYRLSVYADAFGATDPAALSSVAYEMVLGRLPFVEAQAAFQASGIDSTVLPLTAEVSWHGTKVNKERGSFAAAKLGGVFEQYVGRRIEITYGKARAKTVRAYIHDIADIRGDLSLSRRLYAELAPLGNDSVQAQVKVLKQG